MFQVTKIDSEDDGRLPLDLILVTPPVEMAWATQEKTPQEGEDLWYENSDFHSIYEEEDSFLPSIEEGLRLVGFIILLPPVGWINRSGSTGSIPGTFPKSPGVPRPPPPGK
jgi:hypothetical protein